MEIHSSSTTFLACVEDCISERKSRRFEEGLNTKVKLDICRWFGKSGEFKKRLHGDFCSSLGQVRMV